MLQRRVWAVNVLISKDQCGSPHTTLIQHAPKQCVHHTTTGRAISDQFAGIHKQSCTEVRLKKIQLSS